MPLNGCSRPGRLFAPSQASNPKVCIAIARETPLGWVTTAPHMRTRKKPALHPERPDNSLLDERHLLSALTEFVRYYNQERPHRTLGLQTPEPSLRPVTGPIRSHPVLNGLHHVYKRAA